MFRGERYGKRVPSAREHRVIELVAQGFKNRDIANAIGTTEHVVKTISEPSTTNSDSGTGSNSPSGTRLADTKICCTPEVLEKWEHRILSLARASIRHTDVS